MVRGKRLRQKQLALYKKQKPRRGRPAGVPNGRWLKEPTMADLRRTVISLMEQGRSAEHACRAAKEQYGATVTAETVKRWRSDLYREAFRSFIRNRPAP